MSLSKLTLLSGAFALILVTNAGAVLVDFENSSDQDLFTVNGGSLGSTDPNFTYSSTAGVGGSGGLDATGNTNVWGYNVESYDIFSIPSLTVQLDAQKGATGGIHNRVGLLTDLGEGFGDPNFYVDYTDDRFRMINTTTADGDVSNLDDSAIAVGNWTRIVLQVTNNGGTWDLSAELFDLGADGTSTPTSIATLSGTESTSDTSIYSGFKVDSGASAVDNFVSDVSVIPETSTLALLGLSGLLFFARRNRS